MVDHRPAYLTPERFPPPLRIVLRRPGDGLAGIPLTLSRRNFAVVQTHALAHDRDWLRALAGQPLAYLGLLGPRARKEQVLREVPLDGAKLFAPIGIDIGADGLGDRCERAHAAGTRSCVLRTKRSMGFSLCD